MAKSHSTHDSLWECALRHLSTIYSLFIELLNLTLKGSVAVCVNNLRFFYKDSLVDRSIKFTIRKHTYFIIFISLNRDFKKVQFLNCPSHHLTFFSFPRLLFPQKRSSVRGTWLNPHSLSSLCNKCFVFQRKTLAFINTRIS